MLNILYHSTIFTLMISALILWGRFGVILIWVIIVIFVVYRAVSNTTPSGHVEIPYGGTILITAVFASGLGIYLSDVRSEIYVVPSETCTTHTKVVRQYATKITKSSEGMLLLKYDTTKIVKSIKRDTIKSNCVSVIDK